MTQSGNGSDAREPATAAAPEELAFGTARGRWVLAATVLGSGIAFLDATVVGIALPSISRTFGGGVGTLQWVITGYSLTLAAFLLLGGSLGDRFGRRRVFSIGITWFALASACCGLAPTSGFLIGARVVQGIGGALLTPGSLAILQASFRPEDRSRAIGAWSGLGGVASAAGPLIGGYLLAVGSWRWVFFINIPLSAFVLAITARHVPESSDPTNNGRVDTAGAALAVDLPRRHHLRVDRGADPWMVEPGDRGGVRPLCTRRSRVHHRGRARRRPHAPARTSSAPGSSAEPTPSPSSCTARSAARCSCCPSSCNSCSTTRRSTRGWHSSRSR